MRRGTKPTTLEIGTISSGTVRVEDVLPAMLEALEGLRLSRQERAQVREIRFLWEASPNDLDTIIFDEQCPHASESYRERRELDLNDTLFDIASDHCPDYCYVGSTDEGDGAEIGVWIDHDSLIGDSADPGYTGGPEGDGYVAVGRNDAGIGHTHAYEVNDHGNQTLYRRAGRRWIECWSVV